MRTDRGKQVFIRADIHQALKLIAAAHRVSITALLNAIIEKELKIPHKGIKYESK